MENRSGLRVDFEVEAATDAAERDVAAQMIERTPGEDTTLAAERALGTRDFVERCKDRFVEPYLARWNHRAVPDELGEKPAHAVGLIVRRSIEQIFRWMGEVGRFRRTRYRGRPRVGAHGQLVAAAYNLLRIAHLIAARWGLVDPRSAGEWLRARFCNCYVFSSPPEGERGEDEPQSSSGNQLPTKSFTNRGQ